MHKMCNWRKKMKTGCFTIFSSVLLLLSTTVSAQVWGVSNEAETTPETVLAKPISLLDDVRETQDEASTPVEIESRDPEVSYYIQSLNLSEDQLATAQKISRENLEAQRDILQKIAALRQEARALEIGSLMAFEAILDDSQKAAFHELRLGFEAAQDGENNADEPENNVE